MKRRGEAVWNGDGSGYEWLGRMKKINAKVQRSKDAKWKLSEKFVARVAAVRCRLPGPYLSLSPHDTDAQFIV